MKFHGRDLTKEQALEMFGEVDTSSIKNPKEEQQKLDKLIADLMDFQDDMGEFGYDFMESMLVMLKQKRSPSEAQWEILKKLEEKYL